MPNKPWRKVWHPEEADYIKRIDLYKPGPKYPLVAASQGLSGWAVTEYDILPDGSVANITLVSESDGDIFGAPSIEATKQFIYFPRITDSKSLGVKAVRNRFTYRL